MIFIRSARFHAVSERRTDRRVVIVTTQLRVRRSVHVVISSSETAANLAWSRPPVAGSPKPGQNSFEIPPGGRPSGARARDQSPTAKVLRTVEEPGACPGTVAARQER